MPWLRAVLWGGWRRARQRRHGRRTGEDAQHFLGVAPYVDVVGGARGGGGMCARVETRGNGGGVLSGCSFPGVRFFRPSFPARQGLPAADRLVTGVVGVLWCGGRWEASRLTSSVQAWWTARETAVGDVGCSGWWVVSSSAGI